MSDFQCVKTSLKSVVKDAVITEKLTNAAFLANRIMTHTLQFIKLYLIHCYDEVKPLPKLDRPFITAVMKTLCETTASGRPPKAETVELKAHLSDFHRVHYQPSMQDTLNYRHMNTVLDYMSTEIITMYENNIKQRFCSYVERFVNISKQKKERIEAIKTSNDTKEKKKEMINLLCRELRKVKNDLLSANGLKTSGAEYHLWIDEQISKIMPQRSLKKEKFV